MSDRHQRRVSSRWGAVENQATLEFRAGDGHRRTKARVINISREGALLISEEAPPLGKTTWVRMESPARTDWVAGIPIRLGPCREVALRFSGPCPDDFLLAAMLGIDLGPTIRDGGRPQSFDDFEVSSVA
jgi:PilZ domain